jgi:hypothetical protein
MGDVELPTRAKPEALYEVCSVLGSKVTERSELYDKIDYDRRQVAASTDLGEELGFVEYVEVNQQTPTIRMDDLGWALHYADDIEESGVKNSFQKAIEQCEPYRNALLASYHEGSIEETDEGNVLKRDTVNEKISKYHEGEVNNRAVNVFLRTAQYAGLGNRKVGRRGYQTRLVCSPKFDEFVEELAEKYELPEPVSGPETEDTTEHSSDEEKSVMLDNETVDSGDNETVSGGDKELDDATRGIIAELRNDDVTIQIDIDISEKSDEEVLKTVNKIRNIA